MARPVDLDEPRAVSCRFFVPRMALDN